MAKRKNRLGIAPFDASEYLDNEEVIAEYLAAALEDPNPDVFLHAVADVAKAAGFQKQRKRQVSGGRAFTRRSRRVRRYGTTRCGSSWTPSVSDSP